MYLKSPTDLLEHKDMMLEGFFNSLKEPSVNLELKKNLSNQFTRLVIDIKDLNKIKRFAHDGVNINVWDFEEVPTQVKMNIADYYNKIASNNVRIVNKIPYAVYFKQAFVYNFHVKKVNVLLSRIYSFQDGNYQKTDMLMIIESWTTL